MPHPPHRTRTRLLAAGLAAAALTTTGYGAAQGQELTSDPGGTTVLLLGRDTRAGLSAAEQRRLHAGGQGCDCSDVIMLMHLSGNGRRAGVLSIPRDVYAPRLGRKINAAHSIGGRRLAERTVEDLTGVDIDTVLTVKFAGFEKIVDDLGGAQVCTRRPLRDLQYTGLNLPAGTHRLDGQQAIAYARSRHNTTNGDITRIRRQQRLTSDLAGRIIDTGDLHDRRRLEKLAAQLAKSLHTTPGNSTKDLLELGWKARNLKLENVEFATPPIADLGATVPGAGSTVALHRQHAQRMFHTMQNDKPLHTAETRRGTNALEQDTRTTAGTRFGCEGSPTQPTTP
ncbi:LCP family protein [Streptomyces boninensis]|uniref:LCP family protein n=1 Tax=Streptomyces boninensis TaxID=2039455 RepID=UPI003B22164A